MKGTEGTFDCIKALVWSVVRPRGGRNTSEHILPLSIENACSCLQILTAQPLCYSRSFRIWRARVDRHLLSTLTLCLWLTGLLRCLLLSGHLLLALVVLERLLFELGHVLFKRHAGLLRFSFDLLPLPLLELLRCHATLFSFCRDLLLHRCHLLWARLLPR